MIDTYMRVVPNGLMWTSEAPELRPGDEVRVKITQPRNGGFHRLAFALFQTLYGYWKEAGGVGSFDSFRKWLTVRAGYFDMIGEFQIPVSISYAKMDQEEFHRLYNAVVDFAISDFLPQVVSRDELEREVEMLIRGFG